MFDGITNSDRVFIIAEAGVNHNGSMAFAKKMVEVAIDSGADAVKFQTFKSECVVTGTAPKAEYQKLTTGASETQLDMIRRFELTADQFREIATYCWQRGIMFLSTPFDSPSIDLLNSIGIPIFKIPSGEITNLPYLRKVAGLGKPVILSTGMADLGEIEDALDILQDVGLTHDRLALLHCNSEYPTPFEDVNLRAMITIAEAFNIEVGYSDHTPGIIIPVAAVAMGARIIEKHFTLDKTLEGPDQGSSLDPGELKQMINAIRTVESALGDGKKKPSHSESRNIRIARKSIVAAQRINKGDRFTEKNLTSKRPGDGLSPMCWDTLIGQKADKTYQVDEQIIL